MKTHSMFSRAASGAALFALIFSTFAAAIPAPAFAAVAPVPVIATYSDSSCTIGASTFDVADQVYVGGTGYSGPAGDILQWTVDGPSVADAGTGGPVAEEGTFCIPTHTVGAGETGTYTAAVSQFLGEEEGTLSGTTAYDVAADGDGDSAPTLTIVKYTTGGDDTFDFTITQDDNTVYSPEIATEEGSGSSDVLTLEPGEYDVNELVKEGWDFDDVSCVYDGDSEGSVIVDPAPEVAGGETIDVDNGDNITCTFSNTKEGSGGDPTPNTIVVVSPADMHGWSMLNYDVSTDSDVLGTTASGSKDDFVTGPAGQPLGIGSLEQSTVNGDDAPRLVTSDHNGLSLSSLLNGFSYSTYVSQNGGAQAPYLVLRISQDGSGVTTDRLFFEPVYQNGTYGQTSYSASTIPNQCGGNPNCVSLDSWQSWDTSAGGWWSENDSAGGPPLTTLADYLAEYPSATLATDKPALRIQSGGGAPVWSDFDGNVDELSIDTTTYDFEPVVEACISSSTFDDFALGSVNGQGGWSATGPYDQEVVSNTYGFPTFGCKTLRISDAVTSGSFGDQIFSPSTSNEAGESAAATSTFSGGTRTSHFEAQFDFGSAASTTLQPGMHLSVSPDRGDGARMSYLRFEDHSATDVYTEDTADDTHPVGSNYTDGIHVYFDDVVNPGPTSTVSDFRETDIATLDRSVPHTIKFSMDFLDGPANDVVTVTIDNNAVHVGTSWEDYYRYDPEQAASGNQVPTVDSLLFRESSEAHPANDGKGFLVDNFSLVSGVPVVTPPTDSDSGNGGGNRRNGSGGRLSTGSNGEVLGAETGPGECTPLLTSYMRLGENNDPAQVILLQNFLNGELGTTLATSGIFDAATDAAVRQFQTKYADEILAPWGLTAPTGWAYILTQWKINQITCSDNALPKPQVTPLGANGTGGTEGAAVAPGTPGGAAAGAVISDENAASSSSASSTASSTNPAAAALGFGAALPGWFWLLVLALIILGISSWYAYNQNKPKA